jgi:hypothetical protein
LPVAWATTGVWVKHLPITPEKILRALREKQRAEASASHVIAQAIAYFPTTPIEPAADFRQNPVGSSRSTD